MTKQTKIVFNILEYFCHFLHSIALHIGNIICNLSDSIFSGTFLPCPNVKLGRNRVLKIRSFKMG